jgi:peptide/nickel transport system substrate-binding protein
LLADGDYEWNADRTELTFKVKEAAKWSDGTPVTAEDIAYTWATHVKYSTPVGTANIDYIEDIQAVDDQTVVVKAKLDADGKAVNPLIVAAYVLRMIPRLSTCAMTTTGARMPRCGASCLFPSTWRT